MNTERRKLLGLALGVIFTPSLELLEVPKPKFRVSSTDKGITWHMNKNYDCFSHHLVPTKIIWYGNLCETCGGTGEGKWYIFNCKDCNVVGFEHEVIN